MFPTIDKSRYAVWLVVAALLFSFFADALHHHSLRLPQSPELAAELEEGDFYCPVAQLLTVVQGASAHASAIDLPTDGVSTATAHPESQPLPSCSFSPNSPRAPPIPS